MRDNTIDFLRFLGLSLIILAHVHSPEAIHQIRCVDVPLLVFVSGLSYGNKELCNGWNSFYRNRLLRLLLPTYIFIACDLIALSLYHGTPSLSGIIKSIFLCTDGAVGYVWIIKVYVLIMLVTPLLAKICKNLNLFTLLILVVSLFVVQESTIFLLRHTSQNLLTYAVKETAPYLVGYSIPFIFGYWLRNATTEQENGILCTTIGIAIIALVLFLYKYGLPIIITPYFKYPPHSYFLIYGIVVSMILWKCRKIFAKISKHKFISFIGQNTMWIYLWHIPFVTAANIFLSGWFTKYFLTYSLAVLVYLVQYRIVGFLKNRRENSILKYFVG